MGRFAEDLGRVQVPWTLAEWTRRGVGRGPLQGPRYVRVARGSYRLLSDELDPTQRIVDARAGMPEGALIAGWAAAFVHGVDNLDGRDDHSYRSLPVPVLLPPRQRRDSTEAISYQQSSRRVRGVVVDGIPVTQRLRTALDLSRSAPDVTEAVVPLDAFLGHRLLKPEHLQLGVERWGGRRGIRQVRAAVGSARVTAIVISTARTTSERNACSVPGCGGPGRQARPRSLSRQAG